MTVKPVAAMEPKETAVASVKLTPVITTAVLPVAGPLFGLMLDTVGSFGVVKETTTNVTFTEAFPPFETKLIIAEC